MSCDSQWHGTGSWIQGILEDPKNENCQQSLCFHNVVVGAFWVIFFDAFFLDSLGGLGIYADLSMATMFCGHYFPPRSK